MTWNDHIIIRQIFTITNSRLRIYFTYLPLSLFISRDQRSCAEADRDLSAEYLGSAEGLRIFRRRDIVGTLTNKASIIIMYYLVLYRLSTDYKIHDLEWPFYVKFSLLWTALWEFIFTYWLLSLFISRDQWKCVEVDRDPQTIWDLRKDCGSFVDATSSEP